MKFSFNLFFITLTFSQTLFANDIEVAPSVKKSDLTSLQIKKLEMEVEYLNKKVEFLPIRNASFTPNTKEAVPVNGGGVTFFVSLEKIEPYLNGYQATFNIGNITAINFNEIEIKVSWNKAFPKSFKEIDTWKKNEKVITEIINKDILPGAWTRVTVNLVPAKPDETGLISFAMTTNKFTLKKPAAE